MQHCGEETVACALTNWGSVGSRTGLWLFVTLATSAITQANDAASKYNPVGVQNDVPVATVFGGGWNVLYRGRFSEIIPSVSAVIDNACGQIMLASKRAQSSHFDVLATIDVALFRSLTTQRNETVIANGAHWYKNRFSLGFAGIGDAIKQTSADTMALSERDRLSWHTFYLEREQRLQMNGGWRSGNNYELNKSDDWERYILTATPDAADVPMEGKAGCLPIG